MYWLVNDMKTLFSKLCTLNYLFSVIKYLSIILFIALLFLKKNIDTLAFQFFMMFLFISFTILLPFSLKKLQKAYDNLDDSEEIDIDIDNLEVVEDRNALVSKIINFYKSLIDIYNKKTESNFICAMAICCLTFSSDFKIYILIFEMSLASYQAICGIVSFIKMIRAKLYIKHIVKCYIE